MCCLWSHEMARQDIIEHLKLITSLLTANVNYHHSRKAFTLLLAHPLSVVTTLVLQLVSELNSYMGQTSIVNSQ